MSELLPCAFCGASGIRIGLASRLEDKAWRVGCVCGAQGPYQQEDDPLKRTTEIAIAAWNSRAPAGLLGRVKEGWRISRMDSNSRGDDYLVALVHIKNNRMVTGTGPTPEQAVDDAKGRIK